MGLDTWPLLLLVHGLFFGQTVSAYSRYNVTRGLAARIAEPAEEPLLGNGLVKKQQYQSHRQATCQLVTIEELLESVFSMLSMPRLYRKAVWTNLVTS
jgi:hypothetical protein